MVEPAPLTTEIPSARRPAGPVSQPLVGYVMLVCAATLFALNGTVSKVVLSSGLAAARLTEIRCLGALAGFALLVVLLRRGSLRVARNELPWLAAFGILGLALVQWLYFVAVQRLDVGVALVIQYLAPLFVVLWARLVYREAVRNRVWAALALAVFGLSLVVELWGGVTIDAGGVAAALGAAFALAVYFLMAEKELGRRDTLSLACYGFAFATLFWSLAQPWWSFPFSTLGEQVSLLGRLAGTTAPVWALVLWIVVLGSIAPFLLSIGALRHLPATRAAPVAMIEPVFASVIAFAWLGESLTAEQIAGGVIVLGGVFLAQTAR